MKNCLKFNVDKCKYMVISRKKNPVAPTLPFLLNGLPIEKVKSFKYLGLNLSSDFSWSNHIDLICAKARKLLDLLYRRYYNHVGCDVIYISLVRLHLKYACVFVWDPHSYIQRKEIHRKRSKMCM